MLEHNFSFSNYNFVYEMFEKCNLNWFIDGLHSVNLSSLLDLKLYHLLVGCVSYR